MTPWQAILGVSRAPFLILTPACVLLGLGSALAFPDDQADPVFTWFKVLAALIGAVAAHVAVNALNEWSDYRSGLDKLTERTPFSGGSGTLVNEPRYLSLALATGVTATGVTVACGLYLSFLSGPGLLAIGVLGVLIIVTYTDLINKQPILCLIAPGLGFGTFMVTGTHYAMTGAWSMGAFWASFVPFFLVNNLLFLNQFPDVEADRQIGRHHIPMAVGRPIAAWIFVAQMTLAFLTLLLGWWFDILPAWSLLGLLMAVPGIAVARGVIRDADNIPALKSSMGLNVLVTIGTPLLAAVGLIIHHCVI